MKTPPDYKKIILTPEEQQIFNLFKKSDKVFLTVDEYYILADVGLLEYRSDSFEPLEDDFCELSDLGKRFKEYQHIQHKISSKEFFKYIITTAISVLALMKSYVFGIDDIAIYCMKLLKQ